MMNSVGMTARTAPAITSPGLKASGDCSCVMPIWMVCICGVSVTSKGQKKAFQ